MKRNRKREPLRFGTVAKSVFTCICIAACGVGYVWQKNQVYRLGDEIKRRENDLKSAEKRNVMLAGQLAQLKSPALLEARCQQYGLGLVAPKEAQIVLTYEPGAEWDNRVMPAVATVPATQPATKPATRNTGRTLARR